MKSILFLTTLILWLFFVPQLYAHTLTLKEAILLAVKNNPDLHDQLLDKSVRIHELRILKQKYAPQFFYNMSLTLQNEDYFNDNFNEKKIHMYPTVKLLTPVGTQLEVFTEQNMGYEKEANRRAQALHISIEQPLLKGRSRAVNNWAIDDATFLNQIQELLYKKTIERVIYAVIMQYHVVQLARENVIFQERWLLQSQRFLKNLEVKVSAGRVPLSDVTASKFEIKQAESYLAQAQLNYRQEMRVLVELLGLEDQDLNITPLDLTQQPQTFAPDLINTILKNDVETQIYQINRTRLQQQWLVLKDNQLVDLKLRGDWTVGRYHVWGSAEPCCEGVSPPYPVVQQNGNYRAQVILSIPLSDHDKKKHQKLALKTQQEKLELQARHHETTLKHLVQGLLEKQDLKKQQMALTREGLILAQKNYDEALLKLDAGRATLFEVITLREKLQDTQLRQQSTEIAYLDIIANIELTAGLLTEKWLN